MGLCPRPLLIVCSLLLAHASTAQGERWWVYCDSREAAAGRPPSLWVRGEGGFEVELEPTADATLISYLGDRSFGGMTTLSIGMQDRNRSLLRFALPKRLKNVVKAEFRFRVRMSKMPPSAGAQFALHAVEEEWREGRVSWNNQPRWRGKAFVTVDVPPEECSVKCDATALVRRWAGGAQKNFGILIKVPTPLGTDLPAKLARTLPWLPDVASAIERGTKQKRLILACVRPAYRPNAQDPSEEMLLATVFADPVVLDLVRYRFVPVRTGYVPTFYTHGRVRGRDPLRPLGGDATKIKAPALVVSTPEGEVVATLESIGTFDAGLVDDFLRRALAENTTWSPFASKDAEVLLAAGALDAAGREFDALPPRRRDYGRCRIALRRGAFAPALQIAWALARGEDVFAADAATLAGVCELRRGRFADAAKTLTAAVARKPRRLAEALYWLGCAQRRTGDESAAQRTFARLRTDHAASVWALKATVRLAWPDRIDPVECLRAVARPDSLRCTERAVAEKDAAKLADRALQYLVEQQREDGSWPSTAGMYRSAITALVAEAVDTWIPKVETARRDPLVRAAARADAWLDLHMTRVDAKKANSFGSAYILDYLLARYARTRDESVKALAQRAVRYLEEGQCPNGAWSYSYEFGTHWRGGFGGWPRTTKGRVHSVNSGPALIFLAAAKRLGFVVDAGRIERGVDVLQEMREAAGVYTYTYPVPKSFARADQSIARGPVCEQALFLFEESTKRDLEAALAAFLKYHRKLRGPVKLDKSWATPNNYSSYFYFYAYYHAALAARALGGAMAKKVFAAIRAEMLRVPELDATWVDFPEVGKPYGTAMALLLLAMTER